jgi:pyruvate kinase
MEDMPKMMEQTSVFDAIGERLRALKLASTGDKIVITAGLPKLGPGSTNTIKLHIL